MEKKVYVGMKLYGQKGYSVAEYTVTKVGRQYFEVEEPRPRKFEIDTLFHTNKDYTSRNYQLYLTKQEIIDKKDRVELLGKLYTYFSKTYDVKATLDQLREVAKILGVNKTQL